MFCFLAAVFGCSQEDKTPPSKTTVSEISKKGCKDCHPYTVGKRHDFGCTRCHGGNDPAATPAESHANLIATPAHPDSMAEYCGSCHEKIVKQAAHSLHFSLKNEVNAVRAVFGAQDELDSLLDIPIHENNSTILDLADDMLRRRCLRCHVYSEGDVYPETVRGTGCAACHLEYGEGELSSHIFVKSPSDEQCLHCHYGNFVGADYYGRYEHDFNLAYRTPYRTGDTFPRPYGVEFHQLAPDIHQSQGMNCIDCHTGAELMGEATGVETKKVTCKTCHSLEKGKPLPLDNLQIKDGRLMLITKLSNKTLEVPQLRHEAHARYGEKAACTVCHAQWTFNDRGTHLVLQEAEDYDPWESLTVQGSFEIEDQLETGLYGEGEGYDVPVMRDKINGKPYLGIWFKGYELRRWEKPLVGRDSDGRLKIFRPILDLHLSYVDADENVIFNSIAVSDQGGRFRPYTPHTIGKAGAFFRERLQENLPAERSKER